MTALQPDMMAADVKDTCFFGSNITLGVIFSFLQEEPGLTGSMTIPDKIIRAMEEA